MFRELVVCLALSSVAYAAMSIAALEPKPEKFSNVEGCYVGELDKVIPLGERAPSTASCSQYLCREADVLVLSCGAVYVQPHCKQLEDPTKPYPDCCPMEECP